MTVERVEKKLNRLTETTERRLDDLEKAVGRLNLLVGEMRTPIRALNPNRPKENLWLTRQ